MSVSSQYQLDSVNRYSSIQSLNSSFDSVSLWMQSEDIWFAAPRKGVMVFALPGERCIADINGDFKVHFQDRQGDFYWYVELQRDHSMGDLLITVHECLNLGVCELPIFIMR